MFLRVVFLIVIGLVSYPLFSQSETVITATQEKTPFTVTKKQRNYRVKDLVRILGYRDNQLMGFGLVVGLHGTGDTRSSLSKQILDKVLRKWNMNVNLHEYETKNMASVVVIAEIPPFAKKGDKISCYVASIGDAKSIQDGILLQTPLFGANGKVYALAQGKIVNTHEDSYPLQKRGNGYIPNGAIIERDLEELRLDNQVHLQLLDFDFQVLQALYETLQKAFPEHRFSIDGGSIVIHMDGNSSLLMQELKKILDLEVQIPVKSKIIINQTRKAIIITGDVDLSPFVVIRTPKVTLYDKIQREAYQGIYVYSPAQKVGENAIFINAASIEELVGILNRHNFTFEEMAFLFQSLVESQIINARLIIQ